MTDQLVHRVRRWRTRAVVATALGLVVAGSTPCAQATAHAAAPARHAEAAPPAAGTRLTYSSGDAVRQGVRLVPDPNGPLERDGQRYSVTGSGGSGGVGIEQVDVVGSDATGTVGDVRFYLSAGDQPGAVIGGGASAVIGDTTRLGDYWVAPAALATLTPGADAGRRISTSTVDFLGQSRDVVTIVTTTPTSYRSATYDLASGTLLSMATLNANDGVQIVDDNGGLLDSAAGSVATSHKVLLGVRQLPAALFGPAPADAAPSSVVFSGQLSSNGFTQAMSAQFDLQRAVGGVFVGQRSITADTGTGVAAPPTQSAAVFCGGVDRLWLADAARTSSPGQVLDTDPFTGFTVSVAGADGGSVVVTVAGLMETTQSVYDAASGRLVEIAVRTQRAGVGESTTDLRRAQG